MDRRGPKHVVLNETYPLKHFVYLVGLHIYYKMIHGLYNIKLSLSLILKLQIVLKFELQNSKRNVHKQLVLIIIVQLYVYTFFMLEHKLTQDYHFCQRFSLNVPLMMVYCRSFNKLYDECTCNLFLLFKIN